MPLENEDTEVEIELEEGEEQGQRPAAATAPNPEDDPDNDPGEGEGEGDDDEDLAEYSQGVQKRIGKLTANWREAQRREQAAIQFAESVKRQLDEVQNQIKALDGSYVTEFENRLKIAKNAANAKLRAAIEAADTDAQVEAQNEIASLAQEEAQLAIVKTRQAAAPTQVTQQPVQQPVQRQPDPKAVAWAQKNSWFGSDEPMTLTAFSIHKSLVEDEGVDPTSDDYYKELDRRMRQNFPTKFKQKSVEEPAAKNKAPGRPQVAGQRPGGTTVQNGKKTVKLSPSQVAIAKKLNVPLAEYAKYVAQQDS